MARYRFQPPVWASVGVTLLMALMMSAGFWQLQRGHQKQALIARMLQAQVQPPLHADVLPAAIVDEPRHLALRGRFDGAHALLQDNQALDGRPGYHVWTPLRLASGALLVVDRGWVAQNPDRSVLPDTTAPADELDVAGLWRTLPRPGWRAGAEACEGAGWPRVVQYPAAADLACILGAPVADGLLLLDPQSADGFARRWQITPEMPPARHYAYALQWFAMALALGILFFKVNIRKIP